MANKPDWLNPRSAAIPIIRDDQGIKVVLVTTKPNKKNWIFPKGQVEMGMTAQASAAKEALEEAGVVGEVSNVVFDDYQQHKWGGQTQVKVYLLSVTALLDRWQDMRERDRRIFSLDEALDIIHQPQKQVLIKLKKELGACH
jgi:8-oxo-dGTP pyrophosphatase MutT (NUDIX family)